MIVTGLQWIQMEKKMLNQMKVSRICIVSHYGEENSTTSIQSSGKLSFASSIFWKFFIGEEDDDKDDSGEKESDESDADDSNEDDGDVSMEEVKDKEEEDDDDNEDNMDDLRYDSSDEETTQHNIKRDKCKTVNSDDSKIGGTFDKS